MKRNINLLLILPIIFLFSACQKFNPDKEAYITPRDFLSAEDYNRLEIDLVYVEGYAPNEDALNELESFLTTRLNKPNGITIYKTEIKEPANFTYSVNDIEQIEEKERSRSSDKEEGLLTAFVFYANKEYSENSGQYKTLGVHYAPTSMALFKSTIDDFSGGIGQPSTFKLEATVLMHEFGHALGLVNTGTPMTQDHEDASHRGHCDNDNCLMHHTVESSAFADILFGEQIPTLDDQCVQDLQANGGK